MKSVPVNHETERDIPSASIVANELKRMLSELQQREANQPADGEVPVSQVEPVVRDSGFWPQLVALAKYMTRTEVHTYAFSVAANAILSLFPFIVLLLTVCRRVFHSKAMEAVVGDLMHGFLPIGQDFVMRNMEMLAHPRKGVQLYSLLMLLITSTGVFLPLEVALNQVWGVRDNRNYLENQMVSLGLAACVASVALGSVFLMRAQRIIVTWAFRGHVDGAAFSLAVAGTGRVLAAATSVLLFFLIYWILPHRKVPASAVLPTAIVVGLLWEVAKHFYVLALPWLDFQAVYGPFYISVGLMMWAFISGLLLLAGAHFSATRQTLRLAREAEAEES